MRHIYLILFLISFPVLANFDETKTEASADMTKKSLDFCCKRDQIDEPAHAISEQEAEQRTQNILGSTPSSLEPSKSLPHPRVRGKEGGQN